MHSMGGRNQLQTLVIAGFTVSACGGDGAVSPSDAAVADAPAPDAVEEPEPVLTCVLNAIEVAPEGTYAGQTGRADAFYNDYAASCSAGTEIAPEVFYRVDLGPEAVDLVLDGTATGATMPGFDLVLSARADCTDAESEIACTDTYLGEHLEVLDASGIVTVIVDGTDQYGGQSQGEFTLVMRTRSILPAGAECDPVQEASRCATGSRCVDLMCMQDSPQLACDHAVAVPAGTAFNIAGTTYPYALDLFQGGCAFDPEAGAPEHVYRIEIAEPSDLVATTDFAATNLDTVLYLYGTSCPGEEVACHDDIDPQATNLKSRLAAENLQPGVYYLVVDGASSPSAGSYQLAVTIAPRVNGAAGE